MFFRQINERSGKLVWIDGKDAQRDNCIKSFKVYYVKCPRASPKWEANRVPNLFLACCQFRLEIQLEASYELFLLKIKLNFNLID